jgi:cytochrome c biogenesis protein
MLKYLSSIKLTIILLIIIVAASILGTLIPQNWQRERYVNKYGGSAAGIIMALQLSDVYHSYWYTALLLLFCINLCVCSVRSFRPLVKSLSRSDPVKSRAEIRELPFYEKINTNTEKENIEKHIRKALTRNLYRLKNADRINGIYYFERGKLSRLGPLITHASIIVILVGGIIVGMLGFKDYRKIPIGETVDVPNSDFQVRADDFKAEFYPDSQIPKEYTSVLTIIEDGDPKLTDTIEVNHPMRYKGVKFYQSAYGISDTIEIELSREISDGEDKQLMGRFKLHVGELFDVPDSPFKLKVVVLIPDFVMDGSGQIGSRSMQPRNPAALIELYEGEELRDRFWKFLKIPEFHGSERSPYSVKFLSVGYYTELQISKDPGLIVVWIGTLLMVIGLSLSFYLSHKKLWIAISSENGGTAVELGGSSYKSRIGFDSEINLIKNLTGNEEQL